MTTFTIATSALFTAHSGMPFMRMIVEHWPADTYKAAEQAAVKHLLGEIREEFQTEVSLMDVKAVRIEHRSGS